MTNEHKILIAEITKLLKGGGAHVSFADAIKDLDVDLRGKVPANMPYSVWQLVEHIRIAQRDMLQFSKDADYKSPKWPDEYWVKEKAPKDDATWNKSVKQIEDDLAAFIELIHQEDIYKKIPHGDGQNILREALQIADHNAYHVAEIVALRRMLNAWK
jgi:hypothetical protein